MNTPTHLLVAAGLLAKPAATARAKWRNAAILVGALLPDLSIYVLFVWARMFAGIGERELWAETYWTEPWQTLGKIGNSFPVFAVLAALALATRSKWLLALALAALLHLALDLPVHVDDAHIHFWPLTEWRFRSVVSYWDARFHGDVFFWLELALGLVLTAILWRRFTGRVTRAVLGLGVTLYIAVPVYFFVMLA